MDTHISGQPRKLNLEEFATVVRKMREVFQWTQETLAELAGLNVRTMQRVENARSASFETRRALARAFEIQDVDAFNKPFEIPTEEDLTADRARFDRDYTILSALPVLTGQQIAKLAEGSMADISQPGFDIKRDTHECFAAMVDYFRDYRDFASEYSETSKFAVYEDLQEHIDELRRLRLSVQYGAREVHLEPSGKELAGQSMTAQITYLIAFEYGKAPDEFAVKKNWICLSDLYRGEQRYPPHRPIDVALVVSFRSYAVSV